MLAERVCDSKCKPIRRRVSVDDQDKKNLLAVIAVIAIIGLSIWLLHAWSDHVKQQDCYLTGRRNCDSIPLDQ
jgi:hypothetical protein